MDPEDFFVDVSQRNYDAKIQSVISSELTDMQLKNVQSIRFMSIEEITSEIGTIINIKDASGCSIVKENCDRRLKYLRMKLEDCGYYS